MSKNHHTLTASNEEKQYAMFIHFAQFAGYIIPLGGWLIPLILWQMKKNESKYIDLHGKIVMNWIISCLIYAAISVLLCFILIGFVILGILGICSIVFIIMGALRANEGKIWNYPLSLRIIK